ncbi:beta-glucanase [Selenomonas ruminantium]|uniref:beta-glucanase n=1 Tax=Selenomonas ruminantium TaxID=971 RepID=UPI00040D71B1|nr:glycoside hydrolase family 16 protein [Selenomonas ruminantium]
MDIRKKAVAAAVLLALSAPVSVSLDLFTPAVVSAAPATETKAGDAFAVDLTKGANNLFEASDGWTNGMPFNCFWHKENVPFQDGVLKLIVNKSPNPAADKVPYSGGEYRSKATYGYGRYEVVMKAIKNDGVVSSFFTYTGPSEGDPWDEIDFEVLGKDTTKVQLNYFRDGKGGHEKMIDLGFDASEDFHTYAFEWRKNSIIWFVDGKEVFRRENEDFPVTKQKIMMNAWNGKGVDEWLKAFDDSKLPLAAEYKSIKYTPFAE